MAKQTINLGTAPTGAGGDTRRTAFIKTQANFDEIYTSGLVERGSNALGEWTKWLDGTLITWGAQVVTEQCLAGQAISWNPLAGANQPTPFSAAPFYSLEYVCMTGSAGKGEALYTAKQSYAAAAGRPTIVGINIGIKPSASHPSFTYGTITSKSYIVYFICIGRWKK